MPRFDVREGVTLLGGGAVAPGDLEAALALAPRLVAADSGAAAALRAGHVPEAVYGDMDSLPPEARAAIPPGRIHAIAEQESTDFDKALRHIRAPVTLAVGFTGDRVDHELAVYHTLATRPQIPCVVLGPRDVILHAPPEITLDLPAGTRLSLFPLAPVTGRDDGLAWPIAGLAFHPLGRIGTSNATRRSPVRLEFETPGMLLILPRRHLPAALRAVATASLWPRAAGPASV